MCSHLKEDNAFYPPLGKENKKSFNSLVIPSPPPLQTEIPQQQNKYIVKISQLDRDGIQFMAKGQKKTN